MSLRARHRRRDRRRVRGGGGVQGAERRLQGSQSRRRRRGAESVRGRRKRRWVGAAKKKIVGEAIVGLKDEAIETAAKTMARSGLAASTCRKWWPDSPSTRSSRVN